ncbi:MAG: DoxX-like family protein [Flavobacteriales bacterium]|nr:DoxX-like family protein [Flavobacteriales bacterium]
MNRSLLYKYSGFLVALVWFINGLVCKVFGLVPRHEMIVSQILGADYGPFLTVGIGFSEILMGVWVLSRVASKFNAVAQIVIVLTMNVLEFILVPDLLLWGRFNAMFAVLFVSFVYYREFKLNPK